MVRFARSWLCGALCLWAWGCVTDEPGGTPSTSGTGFATSGSTTTAGGTGTVTTTGTLGTTSTSGTARTTGNGGAAVTSGTTAGASTTAGVDGSTSLPDGATAGDAGAVEGGGAQPEGGQAPAMAGTVPIDPPAAVGCVTDVAVGDHTFTCQGVEFLLRVDERCTEYACGLIFDVHGATMTGQDMREINRLHELAAPQGYLVVHPTAPGSTWSWDSHPPAVDTFMQDMIEAFHVDPQRVHMTGFSMGSAMTFWFLCNRPETLASTAPVSGSSASQVVLEATGAPCIESLDADWGPRVPILFMSGSEDMALSLEGARARIDGIVSRLGLTGGDEIDGDGTYTRQRWTDDEGMVLDFLLHDYVSDSLIGAILGGHCLPGNASSGNLYACDAEGDRLDWGATALSWFIEHPKPK